MKAIYKYPIPVTDHFKLDMSIGARILCVQVQRERPCVWATFDDGAQIERRRFELRGTGHRLDGTEGNFIGTFQLSGGDLVFHLFERADAPGDG